MNYPSFFTEISEKLAKDIIDKFQNVKVKEVKGEGVFEVVATTETVDRHGEVILLSGWDFTNYMKNPVVLLAHDYSSMPIGAVTEIKKDEENKKIIVKGIFANTEDGQMVRKLYEDGMLNTVSVGFIALEREENVIKKSELLEVSFVSVPANPDALALTRVAKIATKILNADSLNEGHKSEENATKVVNFDQEALKRLDKLDENLSFLKNFFSPGQDTKSGRVLSAKNKSLIQNAISALQELLQAGEPETSEDAGKMLKELLSDAQGMQKVLESVIKKAKSAKSNL